MPLQILVLGISIDLLRWHNRRIAVLIDPNHAVARLTKTTTKLMHATQKHARRLATITWGSLSPEERKNQPLERIEAVVYRSMPDHLRWTALLPEISEIGVRATARGEGFLARNSINSLTAIACGYLDLRRNNLNFSPAALGVTRSDAHDFLNIISDPLIDINRNAIANKSEVVAVAVVQAFAAITSRMIPIGIADRPETVGDLTWHPLGYMQNATEEALRNGMDNAGLEAGRQYVALVSQAPPDVPAHNLHYSAIEGLVKIVAVYLASGKGALANTVSSQIMMICQLAVETKHYEAREIIRTALRKAELLVPLALTVEVRQGATLLNAPFTAPYDQGDQHSLGYLVRRVAGQVHADERDWVNPYHHFINVNEITWRHLRTIAENNDLTSSPILWHLLKALKVISKVYLSLLREPVTDNDDHLKELVAGIGWYMSFTWVAFAKASTVSAQYAGETCDTLGALGLWFLQAGYDQVAEHAASDIASVTESICKAKKFSSQYEVADLLMPIWHLRILAESNGRAALVGKLDGKLVKPESLSPEVWAAVEEALTLRKGQLQQELDEDPEPHWMLERPTDVLKTLLRERDESQPQSDPGEA